VARGLRRRAHVPAGARVVVAVSGGADSLALLAALAALAPRRRFRLQLVVAHVQHHLRPDEEAEGDAALVRARAEALGLRFRRADLDPGAWPPENREKAARRARYEALARLAAEESAGYVATAHHADDQLETLLMRLLRGAGPRGMRGIAWRRRLDANADAPRLIRPMLAATPEEARGLLTALGRSWREDPTNADPTRRRALLRARAVPALKQAMPEAPRRAARHADAMRGAARVVTDVIAEADAAGGPDAAMPRARLRAHRRLVVMGVLRRRLERAGVPPARLGRRVLAPLARAVRDRGGARRRFDLARGVRVVVERETVRIETAASS
jgi:tRNA(Ile)-lysidine synthase